MKYVIFLFFRTQWSNSHCYTLKGQDIEHPEPPKHIEIFQLVRDQQPLLGHL